MSTHIQRSALLPYPARALFDLVNDVKRYPEFLPWCSASQVLEESESLMRAELTVAKGSLSQRFTTRNVLVPGASIEMNLENGPFTELHGVWQFKALGEKACKITLDLTSITPGRWSRRPRAAVHPGRQHHGRRVLPARQATLWLRSPSRWSTRCRSDRRYCA